MFVLHPLVHDVPHAVDPATAVAQAGLEGRSGRPGLRTGGVLDAVLVALSSARRGRGD
jgi:hypothetical protein